MGDSYLYLYNIKNNQAMPIVRLKLKEKYQFSSNPEKPAFNQIGFVKTDVDLEIGMRTTFEDLRPHSSAGHLNVNHYQYFNGKMFIVVGKPNKSVNYELDLIEL